mgnify:CR=1 FL=1
MILKCNDINYVVLCDVLIGLCLELAVLCLYEMATCTLPSAAEEVKAKDIVFTTTPGVTFSSIVEENKKKNKNKSGKKDLNYPAEILCRYFFRKIFPAAKIQAY